MPNDAEKTEQPKMPKPASDPAADLAKETPHNYDGLTPPDLPSPPGQEAAPA